MVKIRIAVIILTILADFIVHQIFGNLIYNYGQKHDTHCVQQLQKLERTKKKIKKWNMI